MIGSTLARVSRPVVARQQRRGIVDWMTNYPDKVRNKYFFLRRRCGGKRKEWRRWPMGLPITADTIENVFIIGK